LNSNKTSETGRHKKTPFVGHNDWIGSSAKASNKMEEGCFFNSI